MVPLHSAPHDAVAEIDALYDVYLAVVNKWGTDVSGLAAPSPLWPRLLPEEEGMATKLGSGPGSGGGQLSPHITLSAEHRVPGGLQC